MNNIEKEQLRMEIQHIFDSGANEIRVFEMVKRFLESRGVNVKNQDYIQGYQQGWREGYQEGNSDL